MIHSLVLCSYLMSHQVAVYTVCSLLPPTPLRKWTLNGGTRLQPLHSFMKIWELHFLNGSHVNVASEFSSLTRWTAVPLTLKLSWCSYYQSLSLFSFKGPCFVFICVVCQSVFLASGKKGGGDWHKIPKSFLDSVISEKAIIELLTVSVKWFGTSDSRTQEDCCMCSLKMKPRCFAQSH